MEEAHLNFHTHKLGEKIQIFTHFKIEVAHLNFHTHTSLTKNSNLHLFLNTI